MVALITITEAQQWAEKSKLTLSTLENGLVDQIATQILNRIAQAYDTTVWTTPTNTPPIVRSIIAMSYVSWVYSKTYSEDEVSENAYALRLLAWAEALIMGILDGTTEITTPPPVNGLVTTPSYYPTDASSALVPTPEDPSLGPAVFTMGAIF